jgi:hypothetical protein
MKKRLTLQLNIYLKHGNKACLAFKKEGVLYRINNLLDSKFFVGNMAQLERAIRTGASQYCHYVLNGTRSGRWILTVTHELGMVSLELLRQPVKEDVHELVFSWSGDADDFCGAARGLAIMSQLGHMCGIYRK